MPFNTGQPWACFYGLSMYSVCLTVSMAGFWKRTDLHT